MASRSSPRMLLQSPPKPRRTNIRVLIALDSPMDCKLLQNALRRFRRQFEIVACAVSKNDILHSFSRGNVDVALVNADLEDGRMAGLEILSELHASYQKTPVVILFDTWQDDLIMHAFRAGANGVFCRSEDKLEMLGRCINSVHEGQVWASSRQMQLLLNALRRAAPIRAASSPGMNLLAARETQVANLVAEGLPNREIGLKLGISEHTVSNYLFRIYNKLGISGRVDLVLYILKRRDQQPAAN
jgi:two-component system nitrate/nitrite response regulator NarL